MDEEADQGVVATTPQQGADEAVTAESMPFDDLQARMRAGEFDTAESDEPATPLRDDTATSSAGQGEGDRTGETAESSEQGGEGQAAEDATQAEPPEDWKRKFDSVAGNNRQLSQQLQQANQALRQMQAQMSQFQVQQQRQMVEAQAAQEIARAVPPEMQQAALDEWRQRQQAQYQSQDTQQQMEAYRQYLLSQQAQQQQVGVQLFRTAVSQDIGGLAAHIAQKYEAPTEPMLEMVQSPAFKDVWGYINSQADLDLAAQVMAAAAETFKARDGARKETNRQQAIVQQTHRVESAPGAATGNGGKTPAEAIATMSDAKFREFQSNLRRQGTMRGLIQ